jgi:hypothetical protein
LRQPRSKPIQTTNALLSALEFCATVLEREGQPYQTHIGLRNNWAIAFNGIVAAGCPIIEDLYCYVNAEIVCNALNKCKESFSLTLNQNLSITSGKFRATVPCLDPILMQSAVPDPPLAPVTDGFKAAVEAVGVLASVDADHVLTASVLMAGPSVIATNRKMIFEAWHSQDLPPNVPLPKQFVSALVKIKKPLAQFGYSNNSATFYFDDGSWLKTQLYNAEWPDIASILNKPTNLWPIDPGFFDAVNAVLPFSEDGMIYFEQGLLKSHPDDGVGASHECNGIPKGPVYPGKQLLMIKPYAERVDFVSHNRLTFEGKMVRGCIAGQSR